MTTTVQFQLRLTPEERDLIRHAADIEHRSMQQVVRLAALERAHRTITTHHTDPDAAVRS